MDNEFRENDYDFNDYEENSQKVNGIINQDDECFEFIDEKNSDNVLD